MEPQMTSKLFGRTVCVLSLVIAFESSAQSERRFSSLLPLANSSLRALAESVRAAGELLERRGDSSDDRYFAVMACDGSGSIQCATYLYLCETAESCNLSAVRHSFNLTPDVFYVALSGEIHFTEGVKTVLIVPLSFPPRTTRNYVPSPNQFKHR